MQHARLSTRLTQPTSFFSLYSTACCAIPNQTRVLVHPALHSSKHVRGRQFWPSSVTPLVNGSSTLSLDGRPSQGQLPSPTLHSSTYVYHVFDAAALFAGPRVQPLCQKNNKKTYLHLAQGGIEASLQVLVLRCHRSRPSFQRQRLLL